MDALLVALVWVILYAAGCALAAYIVTKAASQFFSGFPPYAWMVWTVAGLIWLILCIRLLRPVIG